MNKKPIVTYKFGEPTITKRSNGTYVDDIDEWDKIIRAKKLEEMK